MKLLKRWGVTFFGILTAVLILLGILMPVTPLKEIRLILLQWAMVIAIFAFFLAFLHLIRVNLARLKQFKKYGVPGLLTVFSALLTLILVFIQGPQGTYSQLLLNAVLIPGEAALMGLTAVTLLLAGIRMARVRPAHEVILFTGVAALMLVGMIPILPVLGTLASWVQKVPAMAGLRGLVLGVALGTLLAGLRFLFGFDRPQSEE